jgi:hypothetical protein
LVRHVSVASESHGNSTAEKLSIILVYK